MPFHDSGVLAVPSLGIQIAATAHRHGLTVVRRKSADFQNTGIKLQHPFPKTRRVLGHLQNVNFRTRPPFAFAPSSSLKGGFYVAMYYFLALLKKLSMNSGMFAALLDSSTARQFGVSKRFRRRRGCPGGVWRTPQRPSLRPPRVWQWPPRPSFWPVPVADGSALRHRGLCQTGTGLRVRRSGACQSGRGPARCGSWAMEWTRLLQSCAQHAPLCSSGYRASWRRIS